MEYITWNNSNNDKGIIGLSTVVFESMAILALEDCKEVTIYPNSTLKKSVSCKIIDGHITLNISLYVKTGNNINDVCTKVQELIVSSIKEMTDTSNIVVNINVKGFYI